MTGPGLVPPPGLDDVWIMSPLGGPDAVFQVETPAGVLDLTGCLALRPLPGGTLLAEDRLLVVEPLLFGQARLCLGRPEMMVRDGRFGGWDDLWDYPTVLAAVAAMAQWEPDVDPEPANWTRHPPSGRRRPGGDPAQEVVRK